MDLENLEVKISDFGFSCIFDPEEGLDLILGSPLYMAPEIIIGKNYNEKVDICAIGVITYMLLSGRTPFPGKDKKQTKQMIVELEINLDKPFFNKLDPLAKDFI